MEGLKRWFIKKLGGFSTIEDFLESEPDSVERRRILTLTTKRLFNTIGADDILREGTAGQWLCEGKILPVNTQRALIEAAKEFSESKLWQLLQNDVKYQANRKMYILGKSDDDLTAGKLWVLTLDAINTRLSSMAKDRGNYNSKM